MSETFLNGKIELHCVDCLEMLPALAESSIDACVTDPPYHLTSIVKRFANAKAENETYAATSNSGYMSRGFMGKAWDGGDIAFRPEVWREVWRVLKPGAHLLAFGGTRTYHRLACAIEDAGFEIRDCIQWLYGSGFPKSHDVSKGIDRAAGAERSDIIGLKRTGISARSRDGEMVGGIAIESAKHIAELAPAPAAARQWQGWGTALKPAAELCVLARKPLSESTVAANVLKWGTGALNIDGCRVGVPSKECLDGPCYSPVACGAFGYCRLYNFEIVSTHSRGSNTAHPSHPGAKSVEETGRLTRQDLIEKKLRIGRWPANVIHDGSEEVVAGFPELHASGPSSRGPMSGVHDYGFDGYGQSIGYDSGVGSAARFFYTAKADADDRLGSKHPTVKPLDLMQYLVRLVCPSGGIVLDPFAGTGTTGEAAWREGMKAVLVEREAEYQADIRRRMALCLSGLDERAREAIKERTKDKPVDHGPLFSWSN